MRRTKMEDSQLWFAMDPGEPLGKVEKVEMEYKLRQESICRSEQYGNDKHRDPKGRVSIHQKH